MLSCVEKDMKWAIFGDGYDVRNNGGSHLTWHDSPRPVL
jgi:hypothetical protein